MANQNEIEVLKAEIEKLSKAVNELKNQKDEDIQKSIQEYIPKDIIDEFKKLTNKIDIQELKEKLPEEKLEEVKEKSKKIIESVEDFTKNHPIASVMGALTVGYLIGKIKK